MNLFRKRQPEDVPGWAMNMNAPDFERFLKIVEGSIRKRNIAPIIHREEGFWAPKGNPDHRYGLHNLVQMCAPHVPLQWPEIIEHHMQITLSVKAETLSTNYEEVKDKVKLRLLPLDTELNFEMVEYPVCDAFITVLAIDYPQSIALIKAQAIDDWPIAKSQIYDLALQNMWEQDMPQIRDLETSEGSHLIEFRSPSFFTASHALMLDRHLKRPAENGALVIIPTRDNAFYHVIEDLKVVGEISRMISIAQQFYSQGPGPVTPSLLWWRDGKFTNLPWEPLGDQLNFSPPPDFVEVLNSLAE